MKYWLEVQQTELVPSGTQNFVPKAQVPEQVVTWASYSLSLSMVKNVSEVPVVLVMISLKYVKTWVTGIGKVLTRLAVQTARSDTVCMVVQVSPSFDPVKTNDLGALVGLP